MQGLERVHGDAAKLRGKPEELRHVAFVGGGGMSGGVAVQPEVLEEVAKLLRHRVTAAAEASALRFAITVPHVERRFQPARRRSTRRGRATRARRWPSSVRRASSAAGRPADPEAA